MGRAETWDGRDSAGWLNVSDAKQPAATEPAQGIEFRWSLSPRQWQVVELPLPSPQTVQGLASRWPQGLPEGWSLTVWGETIPADRWGQTALQAGDRVELLRPLPKDALAQRHERVRSGPRPRRQVLPKRQK